MTTRQAVLASVVDSSHVSLGKESVVLRCGFLIHGLAIQDDEAPPQSLNNKGKKKQLNETELALRREETARKRRNLTEKKLEDEKVGLTILVSTLRVV